MQDVIQDHFNAGDQNSFNTLVQQILTLLGSKVRNLNAQENQKYGTIDERMKGFVNKTKDYHDNQPALDSPEVDWPEFLLDFFDRSFLDNGADALEQVAKTMRETRRMHDYDNYQNALIDKSYAEYKARTQSGSGFDSKATAYKAFFPHTNNP